LCIGETLDERETGMIESVLKDQILGCLAKTKPGVRLIVAYEPVWAIGTGKVATPQQVNETHYIVKNLLASAGFPEAQILYGGSVKPDNAQELLRIPNVDGFLVGGASLEVNSFVSIIQNSLS
jgi:triosephosphate isomerase (TIM)